MFICMSIKIRNADLHERFSPIFDEQCIKLFQLNTLSQKRKRLTKLFHKMNKLENSTMTNNACHLPKFS